MESATFPAVLCMTKFFHRSLKLEHLNLQLWMQAWNSARMANRVASTVWRTKVRLYQKATIHPLTTMLSTSKNVLFPGHNHLLTIAADDPSFKLPCRLFTEGSVIPPEHRLMLVSFHRECIHDTKNKSCQKPTIELAGRLREKLNISP